jgi:NAD+ diphosphatase
MLKTPKHFTALILPQTHAQPLNFLFRGDALLVRDDDLALPGDASLREADLDGLAFQPVGQLGDAYCQTVAVPAATAAPGGYQFRKMRSLFGVMDDALLSVAGRAFQISEWARTHCYCGACGTLTTQLAGERCMKCPSCGFAAYPRISPAMMVLVKRESSILLARHNNSPTGFFTALAGFVESGESVEDAIHREVFEEVGLKVGAINYFASQPWPFPHSLMIAYTAEYESGDIRLDEAEIAEARWFGPGEPLPPIPHGISVASALIRAHLPPA